MSQPIRSSIRILIAALGGEGGGVLGKWIADMAAREGYLSQTTSVPGVAQRTGATIYYIEIFPRADVPAGQLPVMSMFPTPGDVDIVICSEILEAGRMIQRGFVTPDRTTLITSTHRTYGITEKEAMGNGIIDKQAIVDIASNNAKTFIHFDMLETARQFDSVINAALFGALAETKVLPFARASFEETIRLGKIAIDSNLNTFAASYDQAHQQRSVSSTNEANAAVNYVDPDADKTMAAGSDAADNKIATPFVLPAATTTEGEKLLARVAKFPQATQEMVYRGIKKLVAYQDYHYAHYYLDRLDALQPVISGDDSRLTHETARFLALWMAFEDLPRVAQIKISGERFARFRREVRAEDTQQVGMVEFLHPRVEEFCGVMPAALGKFVLNSAFFSRILRLFAKPRNIKTNSIHGFLAFYLLAKMRRFRRSSLIYHIEQTHIEQWLAAIHKAVKTDYSLALELAKCGRLIKGYGNTRERGTGNLQTILAVLDTRSTLTSTTIATLREAALADDAGVALNKALAAVDSDTVEQPDIALS